MGHASGRWFHHDLTGLEAERLLLQRGVNGNFLARPSHTTPGSFTLSVRRGDEVTHIRIQNTEEFLDLYGGEKFATLSELVTYYMDNEGQLKEKNGDVIVLQYPLVSEDPTKERWFHGRISGKQAEKMLIERGRYGCFLVRESFHRPGSYVLSVLTGKQVAHIMIQGKPNGMYDVGGGHEFSSLKELINFYNHLPMVEKNGGLVSLKQPFNATRFNVATIDQRILQLEQESEHGGELPGFSEEFEELHQEAHIKDSSRDEGSMPYNRDKNRYKNILPFDRTQVRLRDGDTREPGSGYINANYICWPVTLTESLSTANGPIGSSFLPHTGDSHLQASPPSDHMDMLHSDPAPIPSAAPWSTDPSGTAGLLGPSNSAMAFFFNGRPRYIATQGVILSTQESFWRMVWQERSAVIVMITKIMERGRNKCVRYWPTQEEGELTFPTYKHLLRVKLLSERNSINYTLRQLVVTREPLSDSSKSNLDAEQRIHHHRCRSPSPSGTTISPDRMRATAAAGPPSDGSARSTEVAYDTSTTTKTQTLSRESTDELKSLTVYHYQFTVWPDHGTPNDPSCVLDFMHDISARQDSIPDAGPIIVHCSAGIGRTGTFIVIDMLINYIKTMGLNCDIDISRTIQMIREQRSGMVQTETQYRFIYKAVQQYVNTVTERVKLANDLHPTGRDYTNINRAAEDVGTLASVNAAAAGLFNSSATNPPSSSDAYSSSSHSRAANTAAPHSGSPPLTNLITPSSPPKSLPHSSQRGKETSGQKKPCTITTITSSLRASHTEASSRAPVKSSTTPAPTHASTVSRATNPAGVSGLLQRITGSGRSKARP